MQVRVEPIVEVGVRFPDLLEHLDVEAELVDHQIVRVLFDALEAEARVTPVLTEVAVHRVVLKHCR